MFSFIKKSEFEVLEQVYSVKLDTMELVMMTENIVNNVCRTSIKSPASREDKYIIRRTQSRCSLRGKTWRSTWCPPGTWSIKCVASLSSQGHIEAWPSELHFFWQLAAPLLAIWCPHHHHGGVAPLRNPGSQARPSSLPIPLAHEECGHQGPQAEPCGNHWGLNS